MFYFKYIIKKLIFKINFDYKRKTNLCLFSLFEFFVNGEYFSRKDLVRCKLIRG